MNLGVGPAGEAEFPQVYLEPFLGLGHRCFLFPECLTCAIHTVGP